MRWVWVTLLGSVSRGGHTPQGCLAHELSCPIQKSEIRTILVRGLLGHRIRLVHSVRWVNTPYIYCPLINTPVPPTGDTGYEPDAIPEHGSCGVCAT